MSGFKGRKNIYVVYDFNTTSSWLLLWTVFGSVVMVIVMPQKISN